MMSNNPADLTHKRRPEHVDPGHALANAAHNNKIQYGILDLSQLERLVQFVQKGGKLAAWSLVGTASGLSCGLLTHIAQPTWVGSIGALFGAGIYGVRLFQKYKDPGVDELQQKLDGLQRIYDAGKFTQEEYGALRKKVIEKAKI